MHVRIFSQPKARYSLKGRDMNLAILIGVSNYQNVPSLPACNHDITIVSNLIKAMNKYDDILILSDSIRSCYEAKQKLVEFITNYKGNNIEELFFYYSGHGDYDGKDFYYIWSDYKESSRRQTSIQNNEVDDLIRTLSPEMTFKVIDSCKSGLSYVKDPESDLRLFDKSIGTFKKCYFFYSSHTFQLSFASNKISHFTDSFARSFDKPIGTRIRYKDIMDYISDSFNSNTVQKPHFICQADNTEYVTTISDDITKVIEKYLNEKSSLLSLKSARALFEIIAEDSRRYASKEETVELFKRLWDISSSYILTNDINRLYTLAVEKNEKLESTPMQDQLAIWLQEQKERYFSKVHYGSRFVTRQVPKNPIAAITSLYNNSDDYKTVNEIEHYPASIESTVEQDYQSITFTLAPKLPNIQQIKFHLVPIISQITLSVFYGVQYFQRKDWDKFYPEKNTFKWKILSCSIKDALHSDQQIRNVLENMTGEVYAHLNNLFNANASVNDFLDHVESSKENNDGKIVTSE